MSDPRPLDAVPRVELPTTKSQLARLGERLAAGTPAPGDDELYLAFLDAYDTVQVGLVGALRAVNWQDYLSFLPALDIVGRTKTRDTLVQKLRRDPRTKLPAIRDVAGVRIVGDLSLIDQHVIAGMLADRIARGRVIDRLAEPQSGYRALHAAITVAGVPVEVQVRTRLQHLWAEVFERLADRWGRQIRYGGAPDDPRSPGAVDDGVSLEYRQATIAALQELSVETIAAVETTLSSARAVRAGATEEGLLGDTARQLLSLTQLPPEQAAQLEEAMAVNLAPYQEVRRRAEEQLLNLVSALDTGPLSRPGPDTVEER